MATDAVPAGEELPSTAARFTDRVDNYRRFRPTYPHALVDLMVAECGYTPGHDIADVGSGTGLLSELFLKQGNRVYGVEPNPAMRAAAEEELAHYPSFTSVAGTAEATTLDAASVDFVAAGQAFHWFDPAAARAEFSRILRPPQWVVLVWNSRAWDANPFMTAYEELVERYGKEYGRVRHQRLKEEDFAAFFGAAGYHTATFPNAQVLDHEALVGRHLSSSYIPQEESGVGRPMMAELDELFAQHEEHGRVLMVYQTEVYYGLLS